MSLDYLGGANVVTRVFIKGRQECQRCEDGSRGHRDATEGRVYELWTKSAPRNRFCREPPRDKLYQHLDIRNSPSEP